MSSKIILKKSSVASKIPNVTDLSYGELAINYTDGKLYFRKSNDVISQFRVIDNTDQVPEGNSNLYFTNNRIDSYLSGGTGVNYSSGTISIGQPVETTANVQFGSVRVGFNAVLEEATVIKTTSSSDFTIANFSSSSYSSAKLVIHAEDYEIAGGGDTQITEMLITHKGDGTAHATEYGIVSTTDSPFVSYDVAINSGIVEVDADFSVSGSVYFKTLLTLFTRQPLGA